VILPWSFQCCVHAGVGPLSPLAPLRWARIVIVPPPRGGTVAPATEECALVLLNVRLGLTTSNLQRSNLIRDIGTQRGENGLPAQDRFASTRALNRRGEGTP
jgi:hypothetical protein